MTANTNLTNSSKDNTTYSVNDIAIILGISKKSAYKLCEQNYFITKRIGRIIRINKRSFDEWFQQT